MRLGFILFSTGIAASIVPEPVAALSGLIGVGALALRRRARINQV